jgi:hypothetical protein
MRSWKPRLALASVTVLALAVTLLVYGRGAADAVVMTLVAAVLVGLYLLRRYARAELLYRPHARDTQTAPDRETVPAGTSAR